MSAGEEFSSLIHSLGNLNLKEMSNGTRTLAPTVSFASGHCQGLPPKVRPTAALAFGGGHALAAAITLHMTFAASRPVSCTSIRIGLSSRICTPRIC